MQNCGTDRTALTFANMRSGGKLLNYTPLRSEWSLNCALGLYFLLTWTYRVIVPVFTIRPVLVTRYFGIRTRTYAIFITSFRMLRAT